jgi:FkbM family methyltransferase
MLSTQLLEIAAQLSPSVATWPRRQPGLFMVGGKVMRFADLHSFYWQIKQIFGDKLYNFRCRNEAPVIIDCGAHTGMASLYFKECFPKAQITAFEADAAIADMCRANLSAHGAGDVEVKTAAVWTHNDGVTFAQSNDDAGHVDEAAPGLKTPSVRLHSLLDRRIDLLKLDVEGAEYPIVEDCGDRLDQVDHIIAEVHALGREQAAIGKMLARLEALGFRYVITDLKQATWMPTDVPPPFGPFRTEKFIMTVYAWHSRVYAS